MTATHALLITDLVDSTGTTERLGAEAASALWAQHDRLARDLLEVWRGHEIDKSDGFLLRFETVADAAGYALAYHRAIHALPTPLRARAGVHAAPLTLRPRWPRGSSYRSAVPTRWCRSARRQPAAARAW